MKKPFQLLLFVLMLGHVSLAQNSVLDSSFNATGIVTTTFGAQSSDRAHSIAIQPDGKSVVAGQTFGGSIGSTRLCLSRYLPDGSLDPSFSGDGKTTLLIGEACEAHTVALQPDGKIVVAGFYTESDVFYPYAARFKPNGAPDNTFGLNGVAKLSFPAFAQSVVIQSDGKILLGGYSAGRMMLCRLLSTGAADTGFGNSGLVFFDMGSDRDDRFQAIALQPDGKIVAGGSSVVYPTSAWAIVARFQPNGSPDTGFGQGGFTQVQTAAIEYIEDLVINASGDITVIGSINQNETWSMLVARFKAGGLLDVNFGDNGVVLRNYDLSTYGKSIGLLHDGRIVVVGAVYKGFKNDFMAARFLPNGADDPGFGDDGKAMLSLGTFYDVLLDLAVLPDDRFVSAGHYLPFYNGHVIMRFTDKAIVTSHLDEAVLPGSFRVFPNPLQENSALYFQLPKGLQTPEICLTDASGRVLRRYNDIADADTGEQILPLQAANLPSGQYFLSVRMGNVYRVLPLIR
ncbi:MAG: hypothetical protein JNL02_02295 [Saprospiraceae bacterium]|nr:hypothetical protein [Saprospiraceae bacterium]